MEELQTEIKAIQDAIQSIRADRSPAPTLLMPPRTPPAKTSPTKPEVSNPKTERQFRTSISPSASPGVKTNSSTKLGSPSKATKPPDDLAIAAERLSRLSSTYLQKLEPPKSPHVHSLDEAFQRLEAQAEQVNQLSVAQETAILKLKVIAEQVELDWKASEPEHSARSGKSAIHLPPICEYLDTSIPHVERDANGGLILTSRSIDLFKAQRDAEFNAEVLRHVVKNKRKPSFLRQLWQWLLEKPSPRKRSSRRATSSPFSIRQAVMWVGGAIATRVILDTILTLFPGLWFPAIAIMALPGAIAIYRSTLTPESGLLWGYRITLIIIGFLIGGRL
jgi:hypothetical protein